MIKRLLVLTALLAAPAAGPMAAEGWPGAVRLVYLPVLGKQETIKKFGPLNAHLEKELGLPVVPVSFDSYEEMLVHLAKGEYDLAYLSPATLVEAAKFTDLSVVAMELDREGRRGYYSLIISRSGSGIERMEDLKGKTFAFTDEESTSGFLVPLSFFLNELKVTPSNFAKRVVFAGDHKSLILGVYKGEYHAGATNSVDLSRTLHSQGVKQEELTVVWQSELIPGAPVCARAALPDEFKKAVEAALLKFNRNKEGIKALQIGGFAPAQMQDYELIKKLEHLRK